MERRRRAAAASAAARRQALAESLEGAQGEWRLVGAEVRRLGAELRRVRRARGGLESRWDTLRLKARPLEGALLLLIPVCRCTPCERMKAAEAGKPRNSLHF